MSAKITELIKTCGEILLRLLADEIQTNLQLKNIVGNRKSIHFPTHSKMFKVVK